MSNYHSNELFAKRRVAAELLGYAVWKLFPNVLLAGGNATNLGFYYDFIFEQPLLDSALSLIEVNLRTLLKEDKPLRYANMMRENAQSFFIHHHQPYLAEKAEEDEQNIIELLQIEDYTGICPVSDIQSTNEIGAIKLLHVQKELEITRIIGTAFPSPQELKKFTKQYDYYLKKKDHRLLGKELNLFSQPEQSIEWLWHPKGQLLRQILQDWVSSGQEAQQVTTPLINKIPVKSQFKYFLIDLEEDIYAFASLSIRQHIRLLSLQCRSQETLPVRLVEYGPIYQNWPKSELDGLFCAYSAWSDRMTICCQKEQVIKELISCLHFIEQIIKIFGFEAHWYIITSLRKSAKEKAEKEAIEWLTEAIQESSISYSFHNERVEEEQLEGPRLELRLIDELQREWPGATVTIVVHERKALDLLKDQIQNGEGSDRSPVVITQSVWGSLDRFIALLVERCEGILPLWLAPEQVRFLAIGEAAHCFVEEAAEQSRSRGIRVKVDKRSIKLSEKVHDARLEKVPYLVVVGEQEVRKNHLTVQSLRGSDRSQVLKLDEFLDLILQEAKCPVFKKK